MLKEQVIIYTFYTPLILKIKHKVHDPPPFFPSFPRGVFTKANVVIKGTGHHMTSYTCTHVRCSEIVVVLYVKILTLANYLTKSESTFSFRGRHFSQMFLARTLRSIHYFPVNTVELTGSRELWIEYLK